MVISDEELTTKELLQIFKKEKDYETNINDRLLCLIIMD
jgi:hypothetical protein